MVAESRWCRGALAAIASVVLVLGAQHAGADSATDAARATYALRSKACESIRITLLSCVPVEGGRGELCKEATDRLIPAAFQDLRSSVESDASKLEKIKAFEQRTVDRLARLAGQPEEADGNLNAGARNEATESRTECFSLIDELEH